MIPRIAIIDLNTLEATGLKNILSDMVPMADVSTFSSVEEMQREDDENTDGTAPFVHFFISSQILVEHADFFLQHQRQTIVLTAQPVTNKLLSHFRTLNTSQLEHDLLKAILTLFQHAHGQHGTQASLTTPLKDEGELSSRETEVLALGRPRFHQQGNCRPSVHLPAYGHYPPQEHLRQTPPSQRLCTHHLRRYPRHRFRRRNIRNSPTPLRSRAC